MENNYQVTSERGKPPVIIDGRNVAGSQKQIDGTWGWERILSVAKYHLEDGSKVTAIIPFHEKELSKKLRKLGAEIVRFFSEKDKENDDKTALGRAGINGGFIVTNDKSMSKHLNGGILDREWFASHRIGFRFDENEYTPNFPKSWHTECQKISLSITEMEVRT